MADFSTSLVREKIVFINDAEAAAQTAPPPAVVRSNRILLTLEGERGQTEKVVIRTQTMPSALRLASRVMFSYFRNGLFLPRAEGYDWQMQWDGLLSDFERKYYPDLWAAVYINGQSVFKTVASPFVDIVEQCALLSIDNYDAAMNVTEQVMRQVGRAVRITHASNVAAIVTDSADTLRCGVIMRANGRDKTFNLSAAGGQEEHRVVQGLGVAAHFLEGINLQRVVRMLQNKIQAGEAAKASPEATEMRAATARLVALDRAINSFEDAYDVKYRPQKPDFFSKD